MLQILRAKDQTQFGQLGARLIADQIKAKAQSVLGLATGSTPIPLYRELVNLYRSGEVDFSQAHSVNLDEYVGLSPEHEQSYRYFMQTHLFDHINIRPERTHVPAGDCAAQDCGQYDQLIRDLGGIDMQVLGIGLNGHIGFNEPDDRFIPYTHRVTLTESTRRANARFFEDKIDLVPTAAVSMGICSIMHARRILLLCTGEAKARILYDALNGDITPRIPASILQAHRDVTVLADEAALSLF